MKEKNKNENKKAVVVKKISDIKINEELYPRREVDEELIQTYAENLEVLPPININQDDILIDGLTRLSAHKRAEKTEIKCIVEHTKNEEEIYRRAVELNASHGKQLTRREKKDVALRLFNGENGKELAGLLSVSPDCFNKWVRNIRIVREEQFKEKIVREYLHGELTEQQVADKLATTVSKVSKVKKEVFEKINLLFREKDAAPKELQEKYWEIHKFNPFTSNIWDTRNVNAFDDFDVDVSKSRLEQNLLYNYTEPFSIVYTPEDVDLVNTCKSFCRRYFKGDNLFIKPDLAVLDGRRDIESIINNLKNKIKKGHVAILVDTLEQDNKVYSTMRLAGYTLKNRIILPLAKTKDSDKLQHGYSSVLVFAVE